MITYIVAYKKRIRNEAIVYKNFKSELVAENQANKLYHEMQAHLVAVIMHDSRALLKCDKTRVVFSRKRLCDHSAGIQGRWDFNGATDMCCEHCDLKMVDVLLSEFTEKHKEDLE